MYGVTTSIAWGTDKSTGLSLKRNPNFRFSSPFNFNFPIKIYWGIYLVFPGIVLFPLKSFCGCKIFLKKFCLSLHAPHRQFGGSLGPPPGALKQIAKVWVQTPKLLDLLKENWRFRCFGKLPQKSFCFHSNICVDAKFFKKVFSWAKETYPDILRGGHRNPYQLENAIKSGGTVFCLYHLG